MANTPKNWIEDMIRRDQYPAFKQAYKKAKEKRVEEFKFEGNFFLVSYAKYVCEYVDSHLKPQK